MEIWREVKGYESYEVSNLGRVKSLARIDKRGRAYKERILKPGVDYNGYFNVSLYKDAKPKTRTIHQLVAESFLNHTPDGYSLVVDHINGVKNDNNVKNLQLVSARENSSKREGTSKHTGVHWNNRVKKWRSQIQVNGKIKYLGAFTNELEAAKSYQNALLEMVK